MTEMVRVWLSQEEAYPVISVGYGDPLFPGHPLDLEDSFEVPAELINEWKVVRARFFAINNQLDQLIVERDQADREARRMAEQKELNREREIRRATKNAARKAARQEREDGVTATESTSGRIL